MKDEEHNNLAWSPERRQTLVSRIDQLQSDLRKLERSEATGDPQEVSRTLRQLEGEFRLLREEYRRGLPTMPLSRSPITSDVLAVDFDPLGLDGCWWDYQSPIRRFRPSPSNVLVDPPSLLALTGAVRLAGPVAKRSFLVSAGPEVPYVMPRLLNLPDVVAVISRLPIGPHIGFPIAYFAPRLPPGVQFPNTWGTNRCLVAMDQLNQNHEPLLTIGRAYDLPEEHYDFDLEPWIQKRKLLWIEPEDSSMALRQGPSYACPYLDQPGRRSDIYIRGGNVWSDEE